MGLMAYNLRRIKGAGVLFVLLWNLLVFSYHQTALGNLVKLVDLKLQKQGGDDEEMQSLEPWQLALLSAILSDFLPKLLYPLGGWLADAKLGRYKVMRYSLWIIWFGSILLVLTSILRYTLLMVDAVNDDNIIMYTLPVFILVYLINAVGIAGFHVNLIPFGIDQMEGASGEQITSFLHWYYWTRNFNFGVIIQLALHSTKSYCNDVTKNLVQKQSYDLYIFIMQMFFLSAALCLDFLFSSKLHKDVKIHNPVKKVRDISAFMLKHKQPVGHRSAYTFTYDMPPTRPDFAKQSYGGPFEDEEVEQVTAFWRIVVFLLAIGSGVFLIQTGYYNYPSFFDHMKPKIDAEILSPCASKHIFTDSVSILSFTISIPIFEFLIYPFFRNYIPRITVRIGLGMGVVLLGLLALLALDVVGHLSDHNDKTCMFYNADVTNTSAIGVGRQLESNGAIFSYPTLLVVVIVIMAVGEMLINISALEFICAQSPYGMRGLIIGIFYMIYGVFVGLLGMVLTGFSLSFRGYSGRLRLSCGSWYIMTVVVLGGVGTLLYIITARWYKLRQRGGQRDVNQQTILEGYYESQRKRNRPSGHDRLNSSFTSTALLG